MYVSVFGYLYTVYDTMREYVSKYVFGSISTLCMYWANYLPSMYSCMGILLAVSISFSFSLYPAFNRFSSSSSSSSSRITIFISLPRISEFGIWLSIEISSGLLLRL